MASGRLGAVDLPATTNTTVYTVPSSTQTALSVSVCNRGSSAVTVRLALAATDTPSVSEWIEYDTAVIANDAMERSGIILSAGQKVVAYTNVATVSVVVYGVEESV